jgi:hypothetical protein
MPTTSLFAWSSALLLVLSLAPLGLTASVSTTVATIREVIYEPDGHPFNGTVTLEPERFGESPPPLVVVQVENGMFCAKLVPTTAASPFAFYTATYSAHNSPTHWVEIWRVAQSDHLSLKDVRTSPVASLPPTPARKMDGDSDEDVNPLHKAIVAATPRAHTPLATTPVGADLPGESGTAGYLATNGSSDSWGNIVTGGSGALDCATVPGVCDIATAIVPLKTSANAWTGANDFSGAAFLRVVSGAGVPATGCSVAANVGAVYMRNDAQKKGASLFVCSQTGDGAYSWELSGSGSSPTLVYRSTGGLIAESHIVVGGVTLTSSQVIVTFVGAAAFTNNSSYACVANDISNPTLVAITQSSGTGVKFSTQSANSTDRVRYVCIGF